jgi:hypothetical protein
MKRYLGTEPAAVIAHFRAFEPSWFAHAEAVATYSAEVVHRLVVHRSNVRELLASVLFQRVAAGFEAVLLLAERGMHTQGLVQRRSALEALFLLGAIWKEPELADDFLRADDERVLQIYKRIKRLPTDVRKALEPEFTPASIDAKLTELKAKTGRRKPPSVADYAEAADLLTWYLTDYSFSSEAAHHAAKDLERQILVDADGEVDGMRWGPEDVPPSELLSNAIDYVLMACFATESLFDIGPTEELKRLQQETNRLVEAGRAG